MQAGKFPENREFNSEFSIFVSFGRGGRRAGVPARSLGRAGSGMGPARRTPRASAMPLPDVAGVDRRTAAAPCGLRPCGLDACAPFGTVAAGQNASPLPAS